MMRQCKAKTQTGEQCKRRAAPGSFYCFQHQHIGSTSVLAAAAGGALIGNALAAAPGAAIGAILGGLIGAATDKD